MRDLVGRRYFCFPRLNLFRGRGGRGTLSNFRRLTDAGVSVYSLVTPLRRIAMNKTFVLLLLAAIAGMGTTAGCYTMIKHPMADLSTEEDMASDENCASCHSAQSEVWFPAPQGPWYPPPWWHDHGHDNDQGSSTPTEPEGRHQWDRGPGAPSAPPGHGVVAPAPTPSPAPAVPGGSDTTGTPPRDREQNKDKDKDKNKGRNAWGR